MRWMATWTRGNGWVDIPYMEHVGVFPQNLLVSWVGHKKHWESGNIQAVVFGRWMLKTMASNAFPIINWVQHVSRQLPQTKMSWCLVNQTSSSKILRSQNKPLCLLWALWFGLGELWPVSCRKWILAISDRKRSASSRTFKSLLLRELVFIGLSND